MNSQESKQTAKQRVKGTVYTSNEERGRRGEEQEPKYFRTRGREGGEAGTSTDSCEREQENALLFLLST